MDTQRPSRRRDISQQVGFVKFPTEEFRSTGEGGLLVRLVVLDTKGDEEYMDRFVPCCGGYQSFMLDECFIGDDLFEPLPLESGLEGEEWLSAYEKVMGHQLKMEARYFPYLNDEDLLKAHIEDSEGESTRWQHPMESKYTSRSFLAVMLLGATGWSQQWTCKFEDLTAEGKDFYARVQALYPGCELRLLTFIDT